MKNEDIKTVIINELQNLPEKIKELELEYFNTNNTLLELKNDNDLWELNILSEIQKELNEQGKPKFSNESLRNAELENRKDSKYKKTESKIERYSKKTQEIKIQLNFLNNKQSNYKSMTHIL